MYIFPISKISRKHYYESNQGFPPFINTSNKYLVFFFFIVNNVRLWKKKETATHRFKLLKVHTSLWRKIHHIYMPMHVSIYSISLSLSLSLSLSCLNLQVYTRVVTFALLYTKRVEREKIGACNRYYFYLDLWLWQIIYIKRLLSPANQAACT